MTQLKNYSNNPFIHDKHHPFANKNKFIFILFIASWFSVVIHLITIPTLDISKQLINTWGTIQYIVLFSTAFLLIQIKSKYCKLDSEDLKELNTQLKDCPTLHKQAIDIYIKQGFIIEKQKNILMKQYKIEKEKIELKKIDECLRKNEQN